MVTGLQSCQPGDHHGRNTRRSATYAPFRNPTGSSACRPGCPALCAVSTFVWAYPRRSPHREPWRRPGQEGWRCLVLHLRRRSGCCRCCPGMYARPWRGREARMRRFVLAGVAVCAAVLALAAPAGAITYGTPDGNGHPEVGALLAPQPYPDGTWATCSGTLIAPTVFLTAAHCDQGVSRVAVTFDSSYNAATGTAYRGTWHPDPDYNQAQSDPHDVAVVVLDKAVKGITPARLPKAGFPERCQRQDALHRGRLRGSVGDHRPWPDLPLRGYPMSPRVGWRR